MTNFCTHRATELYSRATIQFLSSPVGESEEPDELEVDRCDFSEPELRRAESAGSLGPASPGRGTKMTDTQLSSESSEVSLWRLESLLESDVDSLLAAPASWLPSSGASRQHRLRVGERRPAPCSPPGLSSCCFGLFGDQAPFLPSNAWIVKKEKLG